MAKNKWVDEEGKFIEPFRKAGEPRDQWQKRVEKAMIESGLFPRLAYASTFKERQRTKLNKINQNKIDKGIARLEELKAKKGTAGEYAASLQIPKVREGILRARNAISPEYEDPNYEKSWKEDVKGYNLYAEDAEVNNLRETGQYNLGDTAEGGELPDDWAERLSDIAEETAREEREAQKNLLTVKQSGVKKRELAALGGREYTTNFQEAFRNANKVQVYEDTINTDSPLEKSNVFTIDPATGLPLGVMTRSQRRAWDEANARRKLEATLTEEQRVAMEETGRSASDIKAIHSEKGLETVIGGEPDKTGTELGTGLKNIGDASNPEISFKPANDDEDD